MVESYQKHANHNSTCEMCVYNHLTAFRINRLTGSNFEPCLDLTLTYNFLSGHISATIRIWIAVTDYYMCFYIIVIFPLRDILQLINFTASQFLVY